MIALLALAHSAIAADLHICSASLDGAGQLPIIVQGFGSSTADARRSAEQSARILTGQHTLIDAIRGWYGSDEQAAAGMIASVVRPMQTDFAQPGWVLTPGSCEKAEVADSPQGAWTSTWTRAAESVVRPSPGAALEASRRRACLAPYQRSLLAGIDASSKPDAVRNTALAPLADALAALTTCWTETAPSPSASAPIGPDSTQPGRCSAIGADGTRIARGFGPSVERAAEDAIRQAVIARTTETIATLASLRYAELQRGKADAEILSTLGGLAALAGATDAVDRSRLACSTATSSPATWSPTSNVRAPDCNAASWTEMPKEPIDPAVAASFGTGLCELQVAPTIEIFQFATAKASGRKQRELVQNAYKVTGACEVDCLANLTWGGPAEPFRLAGTPDRSNKNTVIAELTTFAKGTQPLDGLTLLPTIQSSAQLRNLLSGELSTRLAAEIRQLSGKADHWKQVEGNWILLP